MGQCEGIPERPPQRVRVGHRRDMVLSRKGRSPRNISQKSPRGQSSNLRSPSCLVSQERGSQATESHCMCWKLRFELRKLEALREASTEHLLSISCSRRTLAPGSAPVQAGTGSPALQRQEEQRRGGVLAHRTNRTRGKDGGECQGPRRV